MNRMTKRGMYIAMLFFLFFAGAGCKKEDPKPVDPLKIDAAVFSFEGNINGKPMLWQAGVDGYHMTYAQLQDNNGILEFNSELKPKDCNENCPNSIRMKLKDYRLSATTPLVPDSLLREGFYVFAMPLGSPVGYTSSFSGGLIGKAAKKHIWNFGDGSPVKETTSSSISHTYRYPGEYQVTLWVQDSLETCTSSVSNTLKLGPIGNALKTDIYASVVSGKTVNLLPAVSGGGHPYSFKWDLGDGTLSNSPVAISHTYEYAGVYQVSLEISDAVGNRITRRVNVPVQAPEGCASFQLPATVTPLMSAVSLSGVTIEWVDENGSLWTSQNDAQDDEISKFEIISIADYNLEDSGKSAKKITATISCNLYSGTAVSTLRNAKAVVVIAY